MGITILLSDCACSRMDGIGGAGRRRTRPRKTNYSREGNQRFTGGKGTAARNHSTKGVKGVKVAHYPVSEP